MAKSIYDVLNIVDVYVEITRALYSNKPLHWENIVDIQQQIQKAFESVDLKPSIYKEVTNLSIDNYENLSETISIRRNHLFNAIDQFRIEENESIFEDKLDELVHRKYQRYKTQLSKTTAIRQEYESFDKRLDFASLGLTNEEFEQLVKHNEREKKVLKPILDIETAKLDNLFDEYNSCIHDNPKYVSAKHMDLLGYLDDVLEKVFVREPPVSKNKVVPLRSYDLVKIFESFGNELFDNVSEDDFLLVFQGRKISSLLNLKPRVLNKVYFLIHNLSENINEEYKLKWMDHIFSSIHWKNCPTKAQLVERIRQKRKDADAVFKNRLANIINVKSSELESLSRS